jgi:hypothetical protein
MNEKTEESGSLERVVVQVLRAGGGLSRRTWALTGLYLLLAGVLVGGCAYLGLRGRPALIEALNTYLFPESWHAFSSRLVGMILERVPAALWINGVVLAGLQLVALTLFPLKEKISLRVERELGLCDEEPDEFPLVKQGIEELKLLLINLAIGGLILWLGYAPSGWRNDVAALLSHLHLAAFFAVDFMAPLAQRHRFSVERIFGLLRRRPIPPLIFGLLMTAPASLAANVGGENAFRLFSLVFLANAVPMAWGVLSGTRLMAAELAPLRALPEPNRNRLLIAWSAVLLVVLAQGVLFSSLIGSIHAKSQVLKCNYSLPLDGFRLNQPSWLGLMTGSLTLDGHLTVAVDNPTSHDLKLEKNRILVTVDGETWWQGSAPLISVAAGQSTRVKVPFEVILNAADLMRGAQKGWSGAKALWSRVKGVFDRMDSPSAVIDETERAIATTQLRFEAARQRIGVTLFIEVLPGFEFPFYLLAPP